MYGHSNCLLRTQLLRGRYCQDITARLTKEMSFNRVASWTKMEESWGGMRGVSSTVKEQLSSDPEAEGAARFEASPMEEGMLQ